MAASFARVTQASQHVVEQLERAKHPGSDVNLEGLANESRELAAATREFERRLLAEDMRRLLTASIRVHRERAQNYVFLALACAVVSLFSTAILTPIKESTFLVSIPLMALTSVLLSSGQAAHKRERKAVSDLLDVVGHNSAEFELASKTWPTMGVLGGALLICIFSIIVQVVQRLNF